MLFKPLKSITKTIEHKLCKICLIMKNIEYLGSNLQTHHFKRRSDLPSRMQKMKITGFLESACKCQNMDKLRYKNPRPKLIGILYCSFQVFDFAYKAMWYSRYHIIKLHNMYVFSSYLGFQIFP